MYSSTLTKLLNPALSGIDDDRATSTASSASLSLFLASEAEAKAEAEAAPACSKGERGDDPSRSSSGEIFWGGGG